SAVPRCEHSDPAAGSALEFGSQTPGTPLGSTPSSEPCHSSSLLRSILKKTPGKELRDSPKVGWMSFKELWGLESSTSAIDRGGGESAVVSSCVKTFETLQTDTAATPSSKTPKKKKVTFGQVLSPEIFDQSLPANTPLRRGASPGCPQSPWVRPGLPQEPLPLLDLGWDEVSLFCVPGEIPPVPPSLLGIAEI
ncbi:CDCA2 protein, partial [Alaudala cheleensis]|nr:CDCA2 protein [Alaudala cheleensis]